MVAAVGPGTTGTETEEPTTTMQATIAGVVHVVVVVVAVVHVVNYDVGIVSCVGIVVNGQGFVFVVVVRHEPTLDRRQRG